MSDYKIQSVLFKRDKWQLMDAIEWLISNEFTVKKVDITKGLFRCRQLEPEALKKKGYTNYHNKIIGDGIIFVIVYKTRTDTNII